MSNTSPIIHPNKGVIAEHDMRGAAIGQLWLTYKSKVLSPPPGMDHHAIECEVYEVDGILSVHTACPKCRHASWIDGRNKKVEYNKQTNSLYVERFECPWEMGGDDDHHDFGFGLCKLTLAYEGKIARDA